MVGYSHRSGVISTDLFYAPILTIKIIKMSKCLLFLSESSMNFNAEFPNLMGFVYIGVCFTSYNPGKALVH